MLPDITLVSALLFGTPAQLLDAAAGSYHRFFFLVFFVHLIPSLAVSAPRLHDIDRGGRWYLLVFTVVGVIPLVMSYCQPGTTAPNRHGEPASQDVALASSPVSLDLRLRCRVQATPRQNLKAGCTARQGGADRGRVRRPQNAGPRPNVSCLRPAFRLSKASRCPTATRAVPTAGAIQGSHITPAQRHCGSDTWFHVG